MGSRGTRAEPEHYWQTAGRFLTLPARPPDPASARRSASFLDRLTLCAASGLAGRARRRELLVGRTGGGGDGRDRNVGGRQDRVGGRCAADVGRGGGPRSSRALCG